MAHPKRGRRIGYSPVSRPAVEQYQRRYRRGPMWNWDKDKHYQRGYGLSNIRYKTNHRPDWFSQQTHFGHVWSPKNHRIPPGGGTFRPGQRRDRRGRFT